MVGSENQTLFTPSVFSSGSCLHGFFCVRALQTIPSCWVSLMWRPCFSVWRLWSRIILNYWPKLTLLGWVTQAFTCALNCLCLEEISSLTSISQLRLSVICRKYKKESPQVLISFLQLSPLKGSPCLSLLKSQSLCVLPGAGGTWRNADTAPGGDSLNRRLTTSNCSLREAVAANHKPANTTAAGSRKGSNMSEESINTKCRFYASLNISKSCFQDVPKGFIKRLSCSFMFVLCSY